MHNEASGFIMMTSMVNDIGRWGSNSGQGCLLFIESTIILGVKSQNVHLKPSTVLYTD